MNRCRISDGRYCTRRGRMRRIISIVMSNDQNAEFRWEENWGIEQPNNPTTHPVASTTQKKKCERYRKDVNFESCGWLNCHLKGSDWSFSLCRFSNVFFCCCSVVEIESMLWITRHQIWSIEWNPWRSILPNNQMTFNQMK